MKYNYILTVILFIGNVDHFDSSSDLNNSSKSFNGKLRAFTEENLHVAVAAIMKSFPLQFVTLSFDNHTDVNLLRNITFELSNIPIATVLFNITLETQQEQYLSYLKDKYVSYEGMTTLFLCKTRLSEHILVEIQFNSLIRKNLYYIFYWGREVVRQSFLQNMHETIKIIVITNPRPNAYRIMYNQFMFHKNTQQAPFMVMVNWWNEMDGLSRHPTVPPVFDLYKNFHGRELIVPVIHKPPWFFINYKEISLSACSIDAEDDYFNMSEKMQSRNRLNNWVMDEDIQGENISNVEGGRDHKLLGILQAKLNFKVRYCDPPERTQGVTFTKKGTFDGALGLIWKREADLFLGDVALTADRFQVAEFSFITLADSGAFITHAPSKLNEALALIRPFQWQVWPVIFAILMLSGPVLFTLVALPNFWRATFLIKSRRKLFFECYWYSVSLFLKQTIKVPYDSNKVRFFTIMVSISTTYIIADMYSANLTSLLAKPGREKAITDLYELEEAMLKRSYKLYVEEHSSSYSLLENGTGVYNRLWRLMNLQQSFVVDSVEEGVMIVKESNNNALLGGRETLFFDIERFGAENFHLSQKLNTAYSAIAVQIGCPYLENINSIDSGISSFLPLSGVGLILLSNIAEYVNNSNYRFDNKITPTQYAVKGGILTKMTENEYEKLGKKRSAVNEGTAGAITPVGKKEIRSVTKAAENNEKLQPISLKMLQGAFYLLLFGCAFSSLTLTLELLIHHLNLRSRYRRKRRRRKTFLKICLTMRSKIIKFRDNVRRRYRHFMNEAAIETLQYLE